jgi:DNA-directed RNA polymerase subunit RPC12/RpoP
MSAKKTEKAPEMIHPDEVLLDPEMRPYLVRAITKRMTAQKDGSLFLAAVELEKENGTLRKELEKARDERNKARVRQRAEDGMEIAQLVAELGKMKTWVDDLQSGMYVNCVYCGHRYGPKETTPVSMADALKKHVESCPKHPMSKLKALCEELGEVVEDFLSHTTTCVLKDHGRLDDALLKLAKVRKGEPL